VEITLASIDGKAAPAAPAVQTSTAAKAGLGADEEDENKDPSAPDAYLDEAVHIVSDWVGLPAGRGQAASRTKGVATP